LILWGLACGQDPVAQLFAHPWLRHFGDLSYPQYVFQFIALSIWNAYTGAGFCFLLGALSVLGFLWVHAPLRSLTLKTENLRKKLAIGILGMISLIALIRILFVIRVGTNNTLPVAASSQGTL
jgi:peptidoglycan/LPS O-acetylase OafA/YrhL